MNRNDLFGSQRFPPLQNIPESPSGLPVCIFECHLCPLCFLEHSCIKQVNTSTVCHPFSHWTTANDSVSHSPRQALVSSENTL